MYMLCRLSSSIKVHEWPCFGEELLSQLTKLFLCYMYTINLLFPILASMTGHWFGFHPFLVIAYMYFLHIFSSFVIKTRNTVSRISQACFTVDVHLFC